MFYTIKKNTRRLRAAPSLPKEGEETMKNIITIQRFTKRKNIYILRLEFPGNFVVWC